MASSINPNIANEKMQYPLHFAAFKKHQDVVKVLLQSKKCDTMVIDRKGRTPAEDTSDEAIRSLILEARGLI
jgi:ankyrin repeat protein